MTPPFDIKIPPCWTAEQADAVFQFLNEIIAALWDIHGENLVHLYEHQRVLEEHEKQSESFDLIDETPIPF